MIESFIRCNKYHFLFKPLFYRLKDLTLKRLGAFDGYDEQVYYKYRHYWAQLYHYDMQWDYKSPEPPDVHLEKMAESWNDNSAPEDYDFSEVWDDYRMGCEDAMLRAVSEHHHILERWLWQGHVFHCPLDEYRYIGYPNGRRGFVLNESPRFWALAVQCKNTVHTVGDEKAESDPLRDFLTLVRLYREQWPELWQEFKAEDARLKRKELARRAQQRAEYQRMIEQALYES